MQKGTHYAINVEIIKVNEEKILLCGWMTGNKEFTISDLICDWN